MKIDGVKTKQLKVLPDERGRLMEILRADDPIFKKFGQVYITTVYPGAVKAWHFHKLQWDNIAVARGMLKLVLFDARANAASYKQVEEYFLGDHNPILVQIPPGVYHGFKGISTEETIVINCPTEPYDSSAPDEFRIPAHSPEVPYDWARKDR